MTLNDTLGVRPRIDQNQAPRIVEKQEENRVKWAGQPFPTLLGNAPSLSTTDYYAVDHGDYPVLPSNWLMLQGTHLRAYINPWVQRLAGGGSWRCNLCQEVTEALPPTHVSQSNRNTSVAWMQRLDAGQRPELIKGTVDFVVSKDYWASNPPIGLERPYFFNLPPASGKREPQPMRFIFALDVSHGAVDSGSLASACGELINAFFGNEPSFSADDEMAITTYDAAIHFYDLDNDNVPMPVMPDINDPIVQKLYQRYYAHRPPDSRPTPSSNPPWGPPCAPAGLLRQAEEDRSYCSSILCPRSAPAPYEQPSEMELVDTSNEKTLYKARDLTWAREDRANEGIGVNVFLMNHKYVDVGSLGGRIDFFPRFDAVRDAAIFKAQLLCKTVLVLHEKRRQKAAY
ncbi:hypothetical protein CYLTODRAFT_415114 [Cylindrobasidium torrendii FP15055 ss-10]|uniref:Uncharacterized protein n=1 Tax=Cylindrobasidium torrendii FP15055 ss-10 TaxID=1314674 RepID=A0A0D7AUL0_9AGAR|nr:hypothetical protein CYLTODRAFT_415114 [Cylindrobasidium torrendii FP15055 ss-10]